MAKFVPCRFPGCPSLVEARSASSLCRVHLHTPGICRCTFCMKRQSAVEVEAEPAPRPQHPDRITVQVAVHVTTSTAENKVAVTLRRAPWQREAVHG